MVAEAGKMKVLEKDAGESALKEKPSPLPREWRLLSAPVMLSYLLQSAEPTSWVLALLGELLRMLS